MKTIIEEQRGEYTIYHNDFECVEVYRGGTLLHSSWGGIAADLIAGTISPEEYLNWYEEQDQEIRNHLRNKIT